MTLTIMVCLFLTSCSHVVKIGIRESSSRVSHKYQTHLQFSVLAETCRTRSSCLQNKSLGVDRLSAEQIFYNWDLPVIENGN